MTPKATFLFSFIFSNFTNIKIRTVNPTNPLVFILSEDRLVRDSLHLQTVRNRRSSTGTGSLLPSILTYLSFIYPDGKGKRAGSHHKTRQNSTVVNTVCVLSSRTPWSDLHQEDPSSTNTYHFVNSDRKS